jgi:hypothetical protein
MWLLSLASFLGTVIVILTGGWGSATFYVWLFLSLTMQLIHDFAVRFCERLEMRAWDDQRAARYRARG